MGPTAAEARLIVVRHLRDQLRRLPALSGVSVWHGWPSETDIIDEMMWAGSIAGDPEIPVSVGLDHRQRRDDNWTVDWYARVAGQIASSPQAAVDATHDRLGVILGAIENLTADDPTLDDQVTLVAAGLSHIEQEVVLTRDGPIGFGTVTLACHSRLD